MSPTEFSNYIKQRAMQQQMHHAPTSPGGRSLSPAHHPPGPTDYFFPQSQYHYSGYPPHPDLYHPKFPSSYLEPGSQFYPPVGPPTPQPMQPPQNDSLNNFGLPPYPAGQYQHLLVAN